MPHRYEITIQWSDDDGAYVARVPALRGCLSFGKTIEEAGRNITEALELYLEVAAKYEKPLPEPEAFLDSIQRLKPLIKLEEVARRSGISYSTFKSKVQRGSHFSPEQQRAVSEVVGSIQTEGIVTYTGYGRSKPKGGVTKANQTKVASKLTARYRA